MNSSSDGVDPRTRRRRPGENRARLVEAGIVEFGLLGYLGASTSSIARRAGVPQPHLYTSFATKAALFSTCLEKSLRRTIGGLPRADGSDDASWGPHDALLAFQAVAAARLDGSASQAAADARAHIRALRAKLGERRLREMLGEAALTLLSGD